jgi:peptidyl-dipeptidase Dcp
VKAVHEQKATLTSNKTTLLDEKYKSFSRNGANLAEDKKTT